MLGDVGGFLHVVSYFPTIFKFKTNSGGGGVLFDKTKQNLISCFLALYAISNIFRIRQIWEGGGGCCQK